MDTVSAVFLGGVGLAVCIPIVVIFWRNLTLSQPWKAIFCFSILPVFLAAMVINIWLADTYAQWLFEALGWAEEIGVRKLEAIIGFMIAVPIALVISFLWYVVIRAADRATKEEVLKLDV